MIIYRWKYMQSAMKGTCGYEALHLKEAKKFNLSLFIRVLIIGTVGIM